MINNRPIIGMVAKHVDFEKNYFADTMFRDEVVNAITKNGGTVVGILNPLAKVEYVEDDDVLDFEKYEYGKPTTITKEEKERLFGILDRLDGIVLQGGDKCDLYEIIIARYALEKDIPILGICAGQNVLTWAAKGAIKRVARPEYHYTMAQYVHIVNVDKNSKFYQIVKTDKLLVNSRHRYIPINTGNYNVVAVDDEGNFDAIEYPGKKFNLGVRFHPESLCDIDEKHNNIFKTFVESCRK